MKRAILVLMIVVFALVTVVPTFAMSQSKSLVDPNDAVGPDIAMGPEYVIGPEIAIGPEIVVGPEIVIDPNDAAIDYFGGDVQDPSVPEDSIIAILRTSVLSMRKAGGDPN